MKVCSVCGRKLIFGWFDDEQRCRSCSEDAFERQKIEAEKEKTRLKNQAYEFYQELVSFEKSIKNKCFKSIAELEAEKAIADLAIEKIGSIDNVPCFADVLCEQAIQINSFDIYIPNLSMVKIVRQNFEEVNVSFQPLLDAANKKIEECKIIRELSRKHKNTLKHIPLVCIVPDTTAQERAITPPLTYENTNITKSTSLSKLNDFISLDVETTGLSWQKHEIIQVSAIRFVGFEPCEAFTTYIKPRQGLRLDAQKINHITEADVADAPYFEQIQAQLEAFVGEKTIIGHNISFDLNFLTAKQMFFSKNRIYDTLSLAKKEFGFERNSLHELTQKVMKFIPQSEHDSLSDAYCAALLFTEIVRRRTGYFS